MIFAFLILHFIDTHCHLNYLPNITVALEQANNNHIDYFVVPSYSLESAQSILQLAEQYSGIYPALAIHPVNTKTETAFATYPEQDVAEFEKLIDSNKDKIVAIGETGLDFTYAKSDSEQNIQIQLFKQHLSWAKKYHLPLIIHNRKANSQLLSLLQADSHSGVLHCFNGNKQYVKKVLSTNFFFGIGGLLTLDTGLQEVVKIIPLERIVLETDTPYLTPKPIRDSKPWPNEPANLKYIAQKLAEIKEVAIETVAQITSSNTTMLFHFPKVLQSDIQ